LDKLLNGISHGYLHGWRCLLHDGSINT